jgi:hypothetical protein
MAPQKSSDWLAWLEERSDTYLTVAELFVVLALAISITVLAILTLIWIVKTPCLQVQQDRLITVLKTLSDNWKAVLILLVPLFYRTIRKFIARIRKGPLGMEADPEEEVAKLDAPAAEPNPAQEEQ